MVTYAELQILGTGNTPNWVLALDPFRNKSFVYGTVESVSTKHFCSPFTRRSLWQDAYWFRKVPW